ncbi:hypothetical protein ARMSODRAFT_214659 [Armillaria solidipes]|uniref:Uncharacterized protein n=1 Tax=Armillaria solidipes TaxID=1076256 RepID=A0A2H3BUT7_9AGAR|nr:hypothetical protein ARMSODRAFT_214659 [Armillaria solidipes]
MLAVGWRGQSETPITACLPSPTAIEDYINNTLACSPAPSEALFFVVHAHVHCSRSSFHTSSVLCAQVNHPFLNPRAMEDRPPPNCTKPSVVFIPTSPSDGRLWLPAFYADDLIGPHATRIRKEMKISKTRHNA